MDRRAAGCIEAVVSSQSAQSVKTTDVSAEVKVAYVHELAVPAHTSNRPPASACRRPRECGPAVPSPLRPARRGKAARWPNDEELPAMPLRSCSEAGRGKTYTAMTLKPCGCGYIIAPAASRLRLPNQHAKPAPAAAVGGPSQRGTEQSPSTTSQHHIVPLRPPPGSNITIVK